ncbi:MAG: beta-propeller fold lactonase family protein [Oscillospiraceae bacterium]|nr:beta-propeller fold lactonase family protein [Oscillospiraceae bacterium]
MKVKVIGKTNLSGTSKKTGKDYNINMVYVTHKANGVEGESCEEIALQANSYPLRDIIIGKVYDVDRDSRGKGIKVFEIGSDGEWKLTQLVEGVVNPSFLCTDRTGQFLYTVHGDGSTVSAYRIGLDGRLSFLNTASVRGLNPVHLAVDRSNRWLYLVSHRSGTIAVLPIGEDGLLSEARHVYRDDSPEGGFSHPRQVLFDHTMQYLVIPSQGLKEGAGKIAVYRVDSETGALEKTDEFLARKHAEPRHCVFRPDNRFLYCVNEWDYSITTFHFDAGYGTLEPRQIVSTLPDTMIAQGWASAIDISDSGDFLYTTDRSYHAVFWFSVAPDGRISFCGNTPTGGVQPRFMCVEKGTGKLYAANECSDTIVEYALDSRSGEPKPTGRIVSAESPVCILFLKR